MSTVLRTPDRIGTIHRQNADRKYKDVWNAFMRDKGSFYALFTRFSQFGNTGGHCGCPCSKGSEVTASLPFALLEIGDFGQAYDFLLIPPYLIPPYILRKRGISTWKHLQI